MSPRTDFQGHCAFCARPVYAYEGVAYGVVGWEGQRSQGGANQIHLRQRVPEKVAHLQLRPAGVRPAQARDRARPGGA